MTDDERAAEFVAAWRASDPVGAISLSINAEKALRARLAARIAATRQAERERAIAAVENLALRFNEQAERHNAKARRFTFTECARALGMAVAAIRTGAPS